MTVTVSGCRLLTAAAFAAAAGADDNEEEGKRLVVLSIKFQISKLVTIRIISLVSVVVFVMLVLGIDWHWRCFCCWLAVVGYI